MVTENAAGTEPNPLVERKVHVENLPIFERQMFGRVAGFFGKSDIWPRMTLDQKLSFFNGALDLVSLWMDTGRHKGSFVPEEYETYEMLYGTTQKRLTEELAGTAHPRGLAVFLKAVTKSLVDLQKNASDEARRKFFGRLRDEAPLICGDPELIALPYLWHVKLAGPAKDLMVAYAQDKLPSVASLPAALALGREFDQYARFLRDLSRAARGHEYGAFGWLGIRPDNLGDFYATLNPKEGKFGSVRLTLTDKSVLEAVGAAGRGANHTHPSDPPYFHFDDPWRSAYGSRSDRYPEDFRLMYELILTPHQAGLLFVTQEGRRYIQEHRPIPFREMNEKIFGDAKAIAEARGRGSDTGFRNLLKLLLQTQRWGQMGFAIYFAPTIDTETINFNLVDSGGNAQDYIQRLEQAKYL